jgi:uncharacterized protein YbaA (DUF1428 family)
MHSQRLRNVPDAATATDVVSRYITGRHILYHVDAIPANKYNNFKKFIQPITVLYVVNGAIRCARWICNTVPAGKVW